MYKNRVENDGKLFEIRALLSCKRGNATENGAKKFKIYVILNFPTLAHLPDGQSCEFLASIDMIYFFGILMTWGFQKWHGNRSSK